MPSDMPGGWIGLEDPDRDARVARPRWRVATAEVRLLPTSAPSAASAPTFSLWQLPGAKSLRATPTGDLRLVAEAPSGPCALTLNTGLSDGDHFALLIPAATALVEARRVLSYARLPGTARSITITRTPAVTRTAIVHLRALQVMDAVRAGASHRMIATAIFGADEVARRWAPDGELRAQVRYLIRRGQALSKGGYRALLTVGGFPRVPLATTFQTI